ncbi:hypothetical protein [Corynebacterium kroppenstedtii]|jgi:hypothetical protein|uniref:Uncharacterized protein n=1 Tax=Corynebacterium kroppenstedtii TaxID=161879 RepID=A0A2W5SZF5_9CORY|nr:hypothetical protein [Corynebacterium kroppenstedtii]MDU7286789.1 hypothetical protein [Corynebacterium kroppenstedtii]PZR04665.1 MAG: hypothetical protein DI525_06390 [Corynebacterium kroppenstedtii]
MKVIDYVRWMGIAAWTGGLANPRHSRGLAIKPGSSARHILIESAGGCAHTLETIEREYTHFRWLLGGSPLDEIVLDYVYQRDLRITGGALPNGTFAVVDFSDDLREYSLEALLVVARQLSATTAGSVLSEHIPPWNLAEPLGLLALAVCEYFTGSTIRDLTRDYVDRCSEGNCETGDTTVFDRLAYSVAHQIGIEPASFFPLITLHVHADSVDRPLLTVEVDATAPLGSVIHDVCDVVDKLGVNPAMDFPVEIVRAGTARSEMPVTSQTCKATDSASSGGTSPDNSRRVSHSNTLPCLWPLALGAGSDAVTDQAIALAAVRLVLRKCVLRGVSWVGVKHSRARSAAEHCITVAIARSDDDVENPEHDALIQGLSSAVNRTCANHFPGSHIACQVVNADECVDIGQWITAIGYHPAFGILPAYMQLERLG